MESKLRAGDNVESPDRATQMADIMAQYETGLLRYATRIAHNAYHAEDIVQNTFIKLFKQWKKGMQPTGKLKAWLYRVTHNEAIDFIRRESRLRLLHSRQAEEQTVVCPNGHNCPADMAERHQLVLQHVNSLQPTEQQVLLLRLEEGLSYNEISAVTGRSKGNVGCILHHAVKKLSITMSEDKSQ